MHENQTLEPLSYIATSLVALVLFVSGLIPNVLGLFGKSSVLWRTYRCMTSSLYVTLYVVCFSAPMGLVGCRTILSFMLYLLTSSLVWCVVSVIGICLDVTERGNTKISFWMTFVGFGIGLVPAVATTVAAPDEVNFDLQGVCWFHGASVWSLFVVLVIATSLEIIAVVCCHWLIYHYGCQKNFDDLNKIKFHIHTSSLMFTVWAGTCCFSVLTVTSRINTMEFVFDVLCVVVVITEAILFTISEPHLYNKLQEMVLDDPYNDRKRLVPKHDKNDWMIGGSLWIENGAHDDMSDIAETSETPDPWSQDVGLKVGVMREADNDIRVMNNNSLYGPKMTDLFGRQVNMLHGSRLVLTKMAEDMQDMISRF